MDTKLIFAIMDLLIKIVFCKIIIGKFSDFNRNTDCNSNPASHLNLTRFDNNIHFFITFAIQIIHRSIFSTKRLV